MKARKEFPFFLLPPQSAFSLGKKLAAVFLHPLPALLLLSLALHEPQGTAETVFVAAVTKKGKGGGEENIAARFLRPGKLNESCSGRQTAFHFLTFSLLSSPRLLRPPPPSTAD